MLLEKSKPDFAADAESLHAKSTLRPKSFHCNPTSSTHLTYPDIPLPPQPSPSRLSTTMGSLPVLTPTTFFLSLLLLLFLLSRSNAQQQYTNNDMLACYNNNGSSTLGYTCTGPSNSCETYLIFRSQTHYQSPADIAYFLNASVADITAINGVDDVYNFPINQLVIVPIRCSCFRPPGVDGAGFYQHDTYYTLKWENGTYLIAANDTYQGLSTCQAMMQQNPDHDSRQLEVGMRLKVPIRCACPSRTQVTAGYNYLLSYIIEPDDDVPTIADRFKSDENAVLNANNLSVGATIFPYTTFLIPLKNPPSKDMVAGAPPPPDSVPPSPPPPAGPSGGDNANTKWVVVAIVGWACFVSLCGLILLFFFYRRKHTHLLPVAKPPVDDNLEYSELSSKTVVPPPSTLLSEEARNLIGSLAVYKYDELERSTGGFDENHRIGGSSVYQATINGDLAAVKRMKGDVSNEIKILKQINHTNLVRLSGFCTHNGNTYLVYEFAENGSLADWIHGKEEDEERGLDWKQRVQVAYDVADGLNYLHNYTTPPCVHKDLKSSNVLLDGELRAKLTNFGLARAVGEEGSTPQQTRHVVGTQGYMPPEYLEHGLISPKIDVFAFGVVLLELLSGKEAVISEEGKKEDVLLSSTIEEVFTGEDMKVKLKKFIDPRLGDDYPLDSAFAMAQMACRCVARNPSSRPAIADVLMTLSAIHSAAAEWDPSSEQCTEVDSMVHTS